MKATEDFLEVVLIAHVTTAAKDFQASSNCSGQKCTDLAKQLVTKFISVSIPSIDDVTCDNGSDGTIEDPPEVNVEDPSEVSDGTFEDPPEVNVEDPSEVNDGTIEDPPEVNDSVYAYAVDVLATGLLWYGFRDAVREGDGDRIILYWKFLLPIFRQEKHYNYAKEAFLLMAQTLLLSPRKVCDLKWNRTVNTTGQIGKNVPVDLHMEHLNRRLKIMIRSLGANVSPNTVKHASKALAIVDIVRLNFLKDEDNKIQNKDHHTKPSFQKDLSMIEQQLATDSVFKQSQNRHHKTFRHHEPLLQSIKWTNICKW